MAKSLDTLRAASTLTDVGMKPEQAGAIVELISESEDSLATKSDLDVSISRAEIRLVMWFVGVEVATTALLVTLILRG